MIWKQADGNRWYGYNSEGIQVAGTFIGFRGDIRTWVWPIDTTQKVWLDAGSMIEGRQKAEEHYG